MGDGEINGICGYALSPRDAACAEELSKLNLKLGLGVTTSKREGVQRKEHPSGGMPCDLSLTGRDYSALARIALFSSWAQAPLQLPASFAVKRGHRTEGSSMGCE